MSSWHYITSYFEDGEKEREKGNYMAAARNYRICFMTFENCELPPFYIKSIDDAAAMAETRYWEVCKLLTPRERWILMTEKRGLATPATDWGENFSWDWKKLVQHDEEMLKQNR